MNTNEEMIFDELMRQKLGDYSELPDMVMMDNIHAKKNRIIKLYKLSKMFTVLCFIGLSLLGLYMLLSPEKNDTSYTSHRPISVGTNYNNVASTHFGKSTTLNTSIKKSNDYLIKVGVQLKNYTEKLSETPIHSAPYKLNNHKPTISKSTISLPENNSNSADDHKILNIVKKDSINELVVDQKLKRKEASYQCKAAFDFYVTYDDKFNFSNFSEANASAKLIWDFGDGTSSELSSPTHIYKNNGNYSVTLKVIDNIHTCSDMMQKNISFISSSNQQIQNISIKGNVIAGTSEIKNGYVSLMLFDPSKNAYSLYSKKNISLSGEYCFNELKSGTYLLLADANNPKYIPTYWGNSIDINQAVEIHIMENDVDDLIGLNISLANSTQISTNDITRNLSSDTSNQNFVIIYDQNNNFVGKAKLDINGNMNLSSLPPGNYYAMNPQTGNMNLIKNSQDGESTIGAGNPNIAYGTITLIPNPAIYNVKFTINISEDNEVADIMIINATGSTVYHKNYTCSQGSFPFDIDISNLPAGEYYVVVRVGETQTLSGRMIKSGNNSTDDR